MRIYKNKNFIIGDLYKKKPALIIPLTPKLYPSEQGCLPEFFNGDFKFYCILLEEKSISHRLFLQI